MPRRRDAVSQLVLSTAAAAAAAAAVVAVLVGWLPLSFSLP